MKIPKPRRLTPRNPITHEVIRNPLYRTRAMASEDERNAKRDGWNRNAKHKGKGFWLIDPEALFVVDLRFGAVRLICGSNASV